MKIVDLLVILAIAGLLALGFYLNRRRKKNGSSCCGDCSVCAKAAPVRDHNRADYPHEASAKITGMTCQNCATTVENALNSLDGIWATVRIDTKTARILSKKTPSEEEIRRAVHHAGYGMEEFTVKA